MPLPSCLPPEGNSNSWALHLGRVEAASRELGSDIEKPTVPFSQLALCLLVLSGS